MFDRDYGAMELRCEYGKLNNHFTVLPKVYRTRTMCVSVVISR